MYNVQCLTPLSQILSRMKTYHIPLSLMVTEASLSSHLHV